MGFDFFDILEAVFPFVFITIFVLVFGGFIFSIVTMFSPKARAHMLKKNVDTMNILMDESKEDMMNLSDDISDITSIGIEKSARAFKNGLSDNRIYCKHCGKAIDADSKYCNYCGERQ